MAAIVCHGLQSHLRLPSSKPTHPQFIDLAFKSFWDSNSNSNSTTKPHYEENNFLIKDNKSTPSNPNSWSFLEALSNVTTKESSQNQTTYVHPNQKRSSLLLSPKSLELCTENLGNESGTDIAENSIDMLCSVNENSATGEHTQQTQPRQHSTTKKAKNQSFPPPLTTIRGSESLRMRPHREDGRLVIEVTKVPPTPSCFQAERSHGRLRLSFLTNPSFDPEEEEEDEVKENEPLTNEKEFENDIIEQIKDGKEEEEETEEETGQEKEECVACVCEESDVIIMDKYERPRRCKEGGDHENNELLNWGDSLCVAIS